MRVFGLFLLVLALVQGAPAASRQAHLSVVDRSPATIVGNGFQARERVRVTLYLDSETRSKSLSTTTAGRLRVTFAVSLGACEMYTVFARGNEGSRATLRVIPACAAP